MPVAALRHRPACGCPQRASHFLLRQSSAANMRHGQPKSSLCPLSRPFLQQIRLRHHPPINAAAAPCDSSCPTARCPATIGSAQALVSCILPRRKQTGICTRIGQNLTISWSLAPCRARTDVESTVTTREWVGRTMEARTGQRRL